MYKRDHKKVGTQFVEIYTDLNDFLEIDTVLDASPENGPFVRVITPKSNPWSIMYALVFSSKLALHLTWPDQEVIDQPDGSRIIKLVPNGKDLWLRQNWDTGGSHFDPDETLDLLNSFN